MSDANHIKAEADYSRGMKYKDIAVKYDVTINTVKSWKQRYSWSRKGVHTKEKSVHTKKEVNKGAVVVKTKPPPEHRIGNEEMSEKHKLFVLEYLRDFNATRAAMAVGYSKKTAYQIGYALLKNVDVQAEITRLKAEKAAELGIDINRIIMEYLKIAFADVTEYLSFGQREVPVMTMFGPMYEGKDDNKRPVTKIVNFIDFKESDEIDGTLISEVKQGKDGVSIKFHDKMKAMKELEKYMDFMTTEQKLKVQLLQAQVKQIESGDDEVEDDGFIEALNGRVSEVWDDVDTEKDS